MTITGRNQSFDQNSRSSKRILTILLHQNHRYMRIRKPRLYGLMCLLLFLSIASNSNAQRHTISGYVRDAQSGESLISASVYDKKTLSGSSTNTFGFYSVTLGRDTVQLIYSYVGYQPLTIKFLLRKDTVINAALLPALLDEVVITSNRSEHIEETQMSSVSVSMQTVKEVPAMLGEVDVLKVLQLLPGVQSGSEGGSGLYVRGGGADQNLILLDGVPVYNVSHLFGFFSVFNADAINKVELVKGGFPARYGGRLSSVIDVNMKDGNMSKIKGEGSVGLIASKFSLEGPLKKDKASFIISARRTYLDIIARPFIKAANDGDGVAGYYFYDLNTKLNYKLNERNRIFLSTYAGHDKAYSRFKSDDTSDDGQTRWTSRSEFGLQWGNIITALRWNHVVNPKLFSNVTATYSRYRFKIFNEGKETTQSPSGTETTEYGAEYFSGIRDWALKADLDFLPTPNHYVRFGASAILHKFTPGVFAYRSNVESDTTLGADPKDAIEYALYLEDDFKASRNFKINAGLHASGFSVDGTFYSSLQPRISARYLVSEDWSVKASYSTMAQFIHLLTNAGLGLPTDLWVPATKRIPPQRSSQVAVGAVHNISPTYDITVEGYYKQMRNLIEYKDGATFIHLDNDWQDKVVVGEGESYGAEVLLRKNLGNFTGWVGYTLSWTNRTFKEINFGKTFPYKYDRRHDVSVAMTHSWNKKRDFSLVWVYGTGNAVSLPVASYQGYDPYGYYNEVQHYEGRNGFRMRSYHRLDLSVSFWKQLKWGERRWTIGVYNAYNRKNPFYMDIDYDPKTEKKRVVEYAIFPIVPSITYGVKF
jgi:hypothetical protein